MSGNENVFAQAGFRCRMEWGRRGARDAASRGDMLVVVDTLRFSSVAAMIVSRGGSVLPRLWEDGMANATGNVGGTVLPIPESREARRLALSPLAYADLAPGKTVPLASPNGATCAQYGAQTPYLFAAALVNARAVGTVVNRLLARDETRNVTILACGERWETTGEDGDLRFSVEDYLGAGAVLSYLTFTKSPEAQICEGAFSSVRNQLPNILWECGSGRELRAKNLGDDVRFCAQLNALDSVPVLRDGRLSAWSEAEFDALQTPMEAVAPLTNP